MPATPCVKLMESEKSIITRSHIAVALEMVMY